MELTLKKQDGTPAGTFEVSDKVFGAPLRKPLLYQAMLVQRANQRLGTQSTQTRAEVSGGGRKPWRQKHTGRARAGSTRSPQWRHGGIALGPKPRDYRQTLPREMRRQALVGLLSEKVRQNACTLVEGLALPDSKTKQMGALLRALGVSSSCLVVTRKPQREVVLAARNLEGIRTLPADTLNVLDLLTYDHLLLTTDAAQRIEELWAERARRRKVAPVAAQGV